MSPFNDNRVAPESITPDNHDSDLSIHDSLELVDIMKKKMARIDFSHATSLMGRDSTTVA